MLTLEAYGILDFLLNFRFACDVQRKLSFAMNYTNGVRSECDFSNSQNASTTHNLNQSHLNQTSDTSDLDRLEHDSHSPASSATSDLLMDNLQKLFDSQRVQSSTTSGADQGDENDSDQSDLEPLDAEMPSTSLLRTVKKDNAAPPFMLQADSKFSSLKSTRLLNQLIHCFVVGGECRLVFPQMIACILGDIPQRSIDEQMIKLQIQNMHASGEQLQVLKLAGVIPSSAPKCELITKSNAERLMAVFLVDGTAPPLTDEAKEGIEFIYIAHDCFGGCSGKLYNSLSPQPCIECSNCKKLFIPESFCRHSHVDLSSKKQSHWGFDSSNWPFYLHLDSDVTETRPDASDCFINFVQTYRQHIEDNS
ncbi:SKI/SNO/DAC family domain-containing protein [Ditylenchus destructor]|uniref:SKI/SNO/DAC family domain-containing protein n=1 Tax=Ditylenchus destructor TaxID=166010 RepID=A0AAD4MN87_9BILA|nr:SKI/SNO/DAC family domain-containing protein [Ditylenchus destructor]